MSNFKPQGSQTGLMQEVPKEWAHSVGYSESLVDSFHQFAHHVHTNNSASYEKSESLLRDQELLFSLSGKTFLMMGDSTSENIYSALCHCERDHNALVLVQGSMEHDSQTECYHDPGNGCDGPLIKTCRLKMLNWTILFLQGEYVIHPYGPIPYERGQNPACSPDLDLSVCLKKKWDASCNAVDSMKCMSDPTCSVHKTPDLVLINANIWFWFRMGWYGKLDEKDYLSMSWAKVEDEFISNMTTAVHTLTGDYLKGVKLVALQTSPGTKMSSRVAMPKVMHINSAIRTLTANLNAVGVDPPVGLLEPEHMGQLGWDRDQFLFDDMHPKFAFNHAVANILLNALAAL